MQNFSFGPRMQKPLSPQFRQSVSQTQFQTFQQIKPLILKPRISNEEIQFMEGSGRSRQQHTPNNQPYLQQHIQYQQQQDQQDNDNSFYSAYLKVQEQKFQQQLANLKNIDEKMKQLGDIFVINLPPPVQNLFKLQEEQKKYESQLLQYAYILGELVTIDTCKENIKLKLRFRLFDILQIFNLSSKKIQRKQFYQNVLKVIGNSSHQYIDTLIKYIFHDRQEIDRQQFTSIFKTNKQQMQNHSTQSLPIPQLVKQFFSSLCQTIYFQNKLRKISRQISYQKLEDSISKNKNFSSEDIQRFVEETVQVKLDIENIDTFFSRILKPRRSGDYVLAEFIEWLESKY